MSFATQLGISSIVLSQYNVTQSGKSNITATTVITETTISLQGITPNDTYPLGTMMFRIGVTDRNPGEVSNVTDGFVVVNSTNGNAFQSINEKWCSLGSGNIDGVDPTFIDRWYSTTPTYAQWGATVGGNEIVNEYGYSIGTSDRTLGDAADAPENFLVLNLATGVTFKVVGGVWTSNVFPSELLDVWYDSVVVTKIEILTTQTQLGIFSISTFTYYVDPVNGSNSNSGISPDLAWQTTEYADTIPLFGLQNIGYLYLGSWYLYRCLNITTDQILLPANIITYSPDEASRKWVIQKGVSNVI